MPKLPHMPLFVFDLESDRDCRAMSDADFGRYMRLLIRQWIEGDVPGEVGAAIRDAMLDPNSSGSVQSLLDRKFPFNGGGRRSNPRLAQVRDEMFAKVAVNRENGKKGGRPGKKTQRLTERQTERLTERLTESKPITEPESEPESDVGGSTPYNPRRRAAKKTPRASRPPDKLFEALVSACGYELPSLTKTERGRANAACAELRDKGVTADEIRKRARAYRQMYPDATLTPQALTGNWSSLDGSSLPPDNDPYAFRSLTDDELAKLSPPQPGDPGYAAYIEARDEHERVQREGGSAA